MKHKFVVSLELPRGISADQMENLLGASISRLLDDHVVRDRNVTVRRMRRPLSSSPRNRKKEN